METSLDPARFRQACARFATGVAVATVAPEGAAPQGLTINSFTSVSLQPPLVLFCIDLRSRHRGVFLQSKYFAINVLGENQKHLSQLFASRREDGFAVAGWRAGKTGAPILEGVISALECRLRDSLEAGDHTVLIGEVLRAEWRDGKPLLYFGSDYRSLC